MLSASRRIRAEQARARLLALRPRWTPTAASVAAELRDIDAATETRTSAAELSEFVPDRRTLPGFAALLFGAVVGALLVWFLAVPRGSAVPEVAVSPPQVSLSGAATVSPDATTVSSGLSASPTAQGVVVVDVQGEVRGPGVIELPVGSRIIDALRKAGGVTRFATTLSLNLAQVLVDGTQVLVPDRRDGVATALPPSSSGVTGGSGSTGGGVVSLNAATLEQLDTLPGIGPVLAQRILDYRTQHGPFTSIDQLKDVSGIGDATFADLQPLVTV